MNVSLDVNVRIEGGNSRAWEGMAFLVKWKDVSSRLIWVKVKSGRELLMFLSAYIPSSVRDEIEREAF